MPLTTTDERARFLAFPQQHWIADPHVAHDSDSFTALFVGHPAYRQFETEGAWHLYYLGFRSERIFHLSDAQHAAPAFVRAVLAHMADRAIGDSPDGFPVTF
ncbi:hypothetical protein [Burkholderia cepacia]|uniref:hypothetical protein n=1 Tax=Burkholderia cepacia TaxID=292 RepID=UPI000665E824|nr:hypothetical protein [Burkholderia cepacia]